MRDHSQYVKAPKEGLKVGLLYRLGSFWVGAHWSPHNKRLCINIIPCVTFWVVWPGGVAPDGGRAS